MTPAQLALFREHITQNRQPEARTEQNAHPRGWNDALDFVERVLKDVLGEK